MNSEPTRERLPEHLPRLDLATQAPEIVGVLVRLSVVVKKSLDPTMVRLVEIRASQLNHCAYCLDMHSTDALAAGESVARIVALPAWRDAEHFYTAREVAALELTEAVTLLADGPVPDAVYEQAAKQFDETELAHLIGAITVINAWNRLMATTRAVPGHYTPVAA